MKKLMLLALASVGLGTQVSANCCSPCEPVYDCCSPWDGFYVGVTAGYTWANSELHTSTIFDGYFLDVNVPVVNRAGHRNVDPKGFNGGILTGYNLQWCSILLSLETEFDAFVLRRSATASHNYVDSEDDRSGFTIVQSIETDWLYTLRPRLGWTWNNWLIYGTGGLAVTRLKYEEDFSDTTLARAREHGSFSRTKTGWTAGAGVEYAFNRCWSIKAEYLYVDFNDTDTNSNLSLKLVSPLANLTAAPVPPPPIENGK